ncbi:hypothetical protein Bbelb_348720 [Branchiostoma belcheri]|nr:hypothetical protein Bbelb_348720 [Branchiostoma belcheri]
MKVRLGNSSGFWCWLVEEIKHQLISRVKDPYVTLKCSEDREEGVWAEACAYKEPGAPDRCAHTVQRGAGSGETVCLSLHGRAVVFSAAQLIPEGVFTPGIELTSVRWLFVAPEGCENIPRGPAKDEGVELANGIHLGQKSCPRSEKVLHSASCGSSGPAVETGITFSVTTEFSGLNCYPVKVKDDATLLGKPLSGTRAIFEDTTSCVDGVPWIVVNRRAHVIAAGVRSGTRLIEEAHIVGIRLNRIRLYLERNLVQWLKYYTASDLPNTMPILVAPHASPHMAAGLWSGGWGRGARIPQG